ncbi:Bacterial conjugation TrbI-like protein (plasmid) [Janthinobacterium sp. HH102]|uniref:TrbI/VirB10 family protein n=1 Tax=Janthinobacterium sp. HH102 TaxID=1537274 RepID=UPI000892F20E|nr:TrbI/VirB10 family protein [Janthinobacterium sp. HH102]QOU76436.1 Bacterial conjugation TrbI-like protein [Janthinobacterium sp. HH102]
MILSEKKESLPTDDRSRLQKVAAVGATPGQKLIGFLAAFVSMLIIVGTVLFKFVIAPDETASKDATKAVESSQAAPTVSSEPQVSVPLNFGIDSSEEHEAAQRGGMQSTAAKDSKPFPPGLIANGGDQRNVPPIEEAGSVYQGVAAAGSQGNTEYQSSITRKLNGTLDGSTTDEKQEVVALQQAAAPALANQQPRSLIGMGEQSDASPQPRGAIAAQLVPTQTQSVKASYITNQHLTMKKGTLISCTTDTAIKTDQMGFVSCITDFPVMSMDGSVILMERGTTINGEYQKGVDRGANAIFILWTDALTPKGVHVNLDSPGTDSLGRAGLDGEVDNKYWQRFSGAFLYSILQDGTAIAAQRASNSASGGAVVVMPNTQATGTSAASEILKQGADVKSTLSKAHGSMVSITVARNVDFSSVYRLKLKVK